MLLAAIALLAGVLLLIPVDYALAPLAVLPAAAALAAWKALRLPARYARLRTVAATVFFVAAGLMWARLNADMYLERRLPERLAGVDLVVDGTITGIPEQHDHIQRFMFDVERISLPGGASLEMREPPSRLRLSWYYAAPVSAGERWRLRVRLKPPHGFMNPGGFDFESWLYRQGVHATGYVRADEGNLRLPSAAPWRIDRWREHIARAIAALHDLQHPGMLQALAVGERSGIARADWDVLIRTGTIHLMAISGLHIGLAAGFGYTLVRFLYARLLPPWCLLRLPAQSAATAGALLLATAYALLAGFTVPTQRALIMLGVVSAAFLLRRCTRPVDLLATALVFVLLFDPACVLSPGFWFSFLAVAAIFYGAARFSDRSLWFRAVWIQLLLSAAMMPLSLWLFQQGSLVSPLVNVLLVPYVSFLVVPPVLAGMVLLHFAEALAGLLFTLADFLLTAAWPFVEALSTLRYAVLVRPDPGLGAVLLATAGAVLLVAGRNHRQRVLALVLLLPAAFWRPDTLPDGGFRVTVLDVGQGLAVVVQTRNHVYLYDTGARFSDRLDSGSAVIVPYLRRQGIDALDRLIISHGDNDHIGGARSVLRAYPQTPVTGSETGRLVHDPVSCTSGGAWRRDGVEFRFLYPDAAARADSEGNNLSCVLRVSGQGGSLLLTGDIEASVERALLQRFTTELDADIIVVPHHGSGTSSTAEFIRAVSPSIAIVAAGYRNRYGFPLPAVSARYRDSGAQLYDTARSGAVSIDVTTSGGVGPVDEYRRSAARYWHHQPPG